MTSERHISTLSEEVTHIIHQMPEKGGRLVLVLLVTMACFMLIFGFIIDYPEKITGRILLVSANPPVKLVASVSGYLRFPGNMPEQISSGELIAYIDNPAKPEEVKHLTCWLEKCGGDPHLLNPDEIGTVSILNLGELSRSFNSFIFSLNALKAVCEDNPFSIKIERAQSLLNSQLLIIEQARVQSVIRSQIDTLMDEVIKREGVILDKSGISQKDFDIAMLKYLESREISLTLEKSLTSLRIQADETENQLALLKIEKDEFDRKLESDLYSNYRILMAELARWEQTYLITAPFSGRVEYLNFWKDNDFVIAGTPLMSIIPDNNIITGQAYIPPFGAGKVVNGQEVLIRLDDFPFREFGVVRGLVRRISDISTNPEEVSGGKKMAYYMVEIDVPAGLETNYGVLLEARTELSGTADILVKKRELIFRLFDNLKYIVRN
ncbi:MAG: HlyD family efflux transporter periplasmic adaptor subunit [Bacteroidales bacterium]|jgi:hypothetical protein|nr:HlyD family efflux transporter periplasmic adaptor subunit [Bacteroidales bacterium]